MASRKRSLSSEADIHDLHKEWDEALCPICMDHPHNAVLLLCTSHEKGCRSYICDTSYRHSNCLDRFRKLKAEDRDISLSPSNLHRLQPDTPDTNLVSRATTDFTEVHANNILSEGNNRLSVESTGMLAGMQGEGSVGRGESRTSQERNLEENNLENSQESELLLRCPLCRGTVLGWKVIEEVRKYLNLKPRSCSHETCTFSGNYGQLRQHARRTHPAARPADIDPRREQAWRRLERHREYTDIVSAIRTAMPGAIVFGDYIIENGDRVPSERERTGGEVSRPWWTSLFLFQMIDSLDRVTDMRRRSRAWARHRRSTGASSRRRFLWGENLLGLQDDDDNDNDLEGEDEPYVNILDDTGEDGSPIRRRRRRRNLTQPRSDEDQ